MKCYQPITNLSIFKVQVLKLLSHTDTCINTNQTTFKLAAECCTDSLWQIWHRQRISTGCTVGCTFWHLQVSNYLMIVAFASNVRGGIVAHIVVLGRPLPLGSARRKVCWSARIFWVGMSKSSYMKAKTNIFLSEHWFVT